MNNILPDSSGNNKKAPLSNDTLMAYLEGNLSDNERHEVEQWLADEGMESDAIEGLNNIDPAETRQMVNKLNYSLKKNLVSKKRKRRQPGTNLYTLVAVIIVLLLAIVTYLIIRIM